MAKLKRIDIFLTEDTHEKLREIANRIGYNVSPSDLIRYSLFKIYKIEFVSPHIWAERIEERLSEILAIKKSKGGKSQ